MQLRGRWALVTGAAKRVGRVVALELAGRGANVVVHYNSSAADAEATVASVRALGVQGLSLRADLADAEQVRKLAADAEAQTKQSGGPVSNPAAAMQITGPGSLNARGVRPEPHCGRGCAPRTARSDAVRRRRRRLGEFGQCDS